MVEKQKVLTKSPALFRDVIKVYRLFDKHFYIALASLENIQSLGRGGDASVGTLADE